MHQILVAESEAIARERLCAALREHWKGRCAIHQAKNGREAEALFERIQPQVAILSIEMPGRSGLEVARRIRQSGIPCMILFLSAVESFPNAREAISLRALDYLLKPFHDGDLENAVQLAKQKIVKPDSSSAVSETKKAGKSKYVQETLTYIDMHYNDPDICVGSIAGYLNISEGHLSHIFKKETGYTILSYLTRHRIQQAKFLLKDCRIKVYEVAQKVGYRDIAYFSSTFKKQVGISPSEYQDSL
jgi:two-component system response regulator YesN